MAVPGKKISDYDMVQIHKCFGEGLTNVVIAERYGVSQFTVSKYRTAFNKKAKMICKYRERCKDEKCSHKFEHIHNGGCINGCFVADFAICCEKVKVTKSITKVKLKKAVKKTVKK